MERKSSPIRKSVEIKFIKDKRAESVRISNMLKTLSKKANELSILCGVEIAILIFLIGTQPFFFGNPDVDSVVHQYLEINQPTTPSSYMKKKKKVKENKDKGKSVEDNFTYRISEDSKLTDAERFEKLNQGIKKLEDHLNKEIDLLQNAIFFEDPKFIVEMDVASSSTIPPNWLSL
ncbi:hypothetical protein H5410_019474 [Solanum commersonii]|uniref:MADS-box domain-containing protein n=1 Tax=Solanum commersonii TaxID=4109 RepID=A0A9J5Z5Q2_SOLCO|nr:hypothetical protein H5410_019474 [Solanum commersonii]